MSRSELLAAVDKRNAEAVVKFVKQVKLERKDVKDIVSECSRRQLETMWECLYAVCGEILTDDRPELDEEQEKRKIAGYHTYLDAVATLAFACIELTTPIVPAGLVDTGALVHGVLLAIPEEEDALKYRWAMLYELWWRKELEGWLDIVGNTFFYLMKRCLSKGTLADVKTVQRWQPVLRLINLEPGEGLELKNLLGQCCALPCFLKSEEGRRFLAHAMTLNAGLVDFMHKAIKNQIPYVPKSWLEPYAEIYFKAWQKGSNEIKRKIEEDVIQNLMTHAIHASRQGTPNMASVLFNVMHYFHSQNSKREVDAMLLRLYNPILWRSLSVPNAEVRLNAAMLMLDSFPLQDPSKGVQEMNETVQKQFDFMQCLLGDPVPIIRAVTAEYVCTIVRDYYELIPAAVAQRLLTRLLQELAWDSSSAAVRLAVIKGMTAMLGNPICHSLLKPLLPALAQCLHDNSEPVRVVMLDLLLKIQATGSIKFWTVCSIEHLLARLAGDLHPVVRRVVQLLFSSFVPLSLEPMEQVSRCISLLESNPAAARVFFLNAPAHMSLTCTVKYMSTICRYVLECVRTMMHRQEVEGASSRPHRKRSRETGAQEPSNDGSDVDDGGGEAELSVETLQGLLETIFLLWTAVSGQLNEDANSELKQSIMKKVSVAIPEVLRFTDNPKVISVVTELAAKLPPKAVPTVSGSCLSKLRNLPDGCHSDGYLHLLEALCMWKMAPEVLQLCCDWLEESLTLVPAVMPSDVQPKKGGKKRVQIAAPVVSQRPHMALSYIEAMLQSSVCKQILMDVHRPALGKLLQLLAHVTALVEKQITSGVMEDEKAALIVGILSLYLRLSVLLHKEGDKHLDCLNRMLAVLTIGEEKLAPLLRHNASETKSDTDKTKDVGFVGADGKTVGERLHGSQTQQSGSFPEACVKVMLTVCSNMLMLGIGSFDFMTQLLSFCRTLVHAGPQLAVMESIVGCLLQLVLFEQLEAGRPVTQLMPEVMTTLVTSLLDNPESDPKQLLASVRSRLYELVGSVVARHHTRVASPANSSVLVSLTSAMMAAVLFEIGQRSKQDALPCSVEKEALPPVTSVVLVCYSRNIFCRRLFIGELENCVTSELKKCVPSEAITNVQTLHALVHLLLIIQSKASNNKGVDLTPVLRAVQRLAEQLSSLEKDITNEDTDCFKDMMATIQKKLTNMTHK